MSNGTVTFVSSSDLGSAVNDSPSHSSILGARVFGIDQAQDGNGFSEFVPITAVGLNTGITDPIDENSHRLGYPSGSANDLKYIFPVAPTDVNDTYWDLDSGSFIDATEESTVANGFWAAKLNAGLIFHRNGPYGWPMWKQTRTGEHKVARWQKKKNIIAVANDNLEVIDSNTAKIVGGTHATDTTIDAAADPETSKKLFTQYTEPVFTNRHKALEHEFVVEEDDSTSRARLYINSTYGNNLGFFANDDLTDKLGLENADEQVYDNLVKIYIDGVFKPGTNPFKEFKCLKYSEKIFPRETNVGLDRAKGRTNYDVKFWRTRRDERIDQNQTNSQGETIANQSKWVLDARTAFPDGSILELSGGIDGAGELQNLYSQYHGKKNNKQVIAAPLYSRFVPMSGSDYREASIKVVWDNPTAATLSGTTIEINSGSLSSGVLYTFTGVSGTPVHDYQFEIVNGADDQTSQQLTRMVNAHAPLAAHEPLYVRSLISASAVAGRTGVEIFALHLGQHGNSFQIRVNSADGTNNEVYVSSSAGVAANNTAVNFEYGSGSAIYFGGQTKWEAGDQSGLEPFNNSYADFSNDLRYVGKDYGVVPEFRISEHMNYYITEKAGDFQADRPGFLTLTGASIPASDQDGFYKTYSTTDFLKHFELTKKDHADIASPSELTLRCRALMKFHPYDGFYPSERTVQLAALFSQSYGDVVKVSGTEGNFRTALQPFFAPGILYNTIKSGIAVDYPLFLEGSITNVANTYTIARGTDRVTTDEDLPSENSSLYYPEDANGQGPGSVFGYDVGTMEQPGEIMDRLPFESIINPIEAIGSAIIVDDELHPSSSIDSYVLLDGEPSPEYSLGMSNFLASTIDFFLEEGKLTSFVSAPEQQYSRSERGYIIPEEERNKKYIMDVMMTNSGMQGLADYANKYLSALPAGASGHLHSSYIPKTVTMYDDKKAFGNPLIIKTLRNNGSSSHCSYAPVTPPYYDGFALARITLDPAGKSGVYSIRDIHQSMSIQYLRLSDVRWDVDYATVDDPYDRCFMQLTASMFLDGILENKSVNYSGRDAKGDFNIDGVEDSDNSPSSWLISTRFETPILDFTDASITQSNSGSVRRGMWHQLGTDISGEPYKGISVRIGDVGPLEQVVNGFSPFSPEEPVNSLADLVGFKKTTKKVGRPASSKEVMEAVVAIPYKPLEGGGMEFYKIPRPMIEYANGNKESLTEKEIKPGKSINDMVEKMGRYVFPPKFDFLTNKFIDPFAMYIFEFKHVFNKEDITNMWQNLPPRSLSSIKEPKETISSITHPMLLDEFYGVTPAGEKGELKTDTRWMVFKVKQKGKWNYFKKLKESSEDERFGFEFELGDGDSSKLSTPKYSYNWPYDYFTMLELIDLEAEVKFKPGIDPEEGTAISDIEGVNPLKDTTQDPITNVLDGGNTSDADINLGPGGGSFTGPDGGLI
jgi:hypothetical protein